MTRLLDVISDYLKMKNISYCSIDGRMHYLDRQLNVERFTNEPEVMVFLLSTRAGGLGINLVAADTCIIYDSDWNPQQDLQAQDRCHRIGQTKTVMVYRLVTKGTIDQVMVERAQAKRALERLVVQRDKCGGAQNLKSSLKVKGQASEIMNLLLSEEVAASCTAGQGAVGLEQEVLDRLMDRTNVQGFREQMELINGKTPEEVLKEMETAEIDSDGSDLSVVSEADNFGIKHTNGSKKAVKPRAPYGSKKHNNFLKCGDCGKVFKYPKSLRKHKVMKKCQVQKKKRQFEFECDKCQAGFHSEAELAVHKNIHLGFKPFKCEHCGKAFTSMKGVIEHARKFHPVIKFSETYAEDQFSIKQCRVEIGDKVQNNGDFPEKSDYDIVTISESETENETETDMENGSDVSEAQPLSKRNKLSHTVQQAALERITCDVCGHKTNTSSGMEAHKKRKHVVAPDPAPEKKQSEPSSSTFTSSIPLLLLSGKINPNHPSQVKQDNQCITIVSDSEEESKVPQSWQESRNAISKCASNCPCDRHSENSSPDSQPEAKVPNAGQETRNALSLCAWDCTCDKHADNPSSESDDETDKAYFVGKMFDR
jgi:uncharacterized C2H2 Zn-finger protein